MAVGQPRIAAQTTHPGVVANLETSEMTNVRQIAFSIMVLTAFMLVLAAPFRWFL
jgi:hypothetical protein